MKKKLQYVEITNKGAAPFRIGRLRSYLRDLDPNHLLHPGCGLQLSGDILDAATKKEMKRLKIKEPK